MQRRLLVKFLFSVSILWVLGLALGCRSAAPVATTGPAKVLYSRVGLRADASRNGWTSSSTNYIGLPQHFPPGTRFELIAQSPRRIDLVTEDRRPLRIEYVEKHNRMPATDWVARHFSEQPVEWDSDLSDSERELVLNGRYETGMSREALFLAIGYPPASLSPDPAAPVLLYQVKRFNKVAFHFDAAGLLQQIRD